MFDKAQLEEALDIHARSYRLIWWLGRATDRGFIASTKAHQYASDGEAASAWIIEHYRNIPQDARPAATSGAGFVRFANYFASYLNLSFEFRAEPVGEVRGAVVCRCWRCRIPSNLKNRRLTPSDKKRASKLRCDYLRQLALDCGLTVSPLAIEALAAGVATSDKVAVLAYSAELLARCAGSSSSPAVLALWRQFAWTRAGSPKGGFVLRAGDILAAEAEMVLALKGDEFR